VRRPRLFWRLYATYLLVVVACTATVGFYAVRSVRDFYFDHTELDLQARAALVRDKVAPLVGKDTPQRLESLVRTLGASSGTRITLISNEQPAVVHGQVLADSDVDPATMENHANRPEFLVAIQGRPGHAVRPSATLKEDMMYVAIPVTQDGKIAYVVRTAVPLDRVNHALATLYGSIAVAALVVAGLAAVIGFYVSRRISRQMGEIKKGAERLAAGDFTSKLYVPRTEEFAVVAESINQMAEDLDDRLHTLTNERNEREAVLSSMVEGVLAVDTDERVIAVNAAAARLLDTDPDAAEGKTIQEVVRNPDLQHVVAQTLGGHRPVEADIVMRVGAEDRNLQANGTLLHGDGTAGDVGAVVVLNDVTRLKRLEAVRRDFVANVSHELKTPVTSIKGFAETLEDGALEDPLAARRFVRIIAGQADRLNSIIEDLLALSTLEQSTDSPLLQLEEADLCDVVAGGVRAQSRGQAHPPARGVHRQPHRPREPATARAGRREPRRQRGQVQRRGQRGRGGPGGGRRRDRGERRRPGPGRAARAPAAAVRALLPRRQGAQSRHGRHRAGARHRQAHRADPRRPRLRRQHRGTRQHVPRARAAQLIAGAARPRQRAASRSSHLPRGTFTASAHAPHGGEADASHAASRTRSAGGV